MKLVVPNFRLDGKRPLVTGAGRGIGLAIARAYAAAGASVTLCSRSQDEINKEALDLCDAGLEADSLPLNVTNVKAYSQALAARPSFDVFVNNAGTNRPTALVEVTEDDYDAVMDLNVRAAVFAAKEVAKGSCQLNEKYCLLLVK